MDYSTLPPNSPATKEEAKEQREKLSKKVSGEVTVKKRSIWQKIGSRLINEDAGSIGDYILDDLLIPTIKNTIVSLITGSAERIFGGKATSYTSAQRAKPNATYVSYNAISSNTTPQTVKKTSRYDFKDIIFSSREDAEAVKDALTALVEGKYRCASVADLYDLIGEDTTFTDNNYGWTNPKYFSVTFTNGGYRLNLPNPMPLK